MQQTVQLKSQFLFNPISQMNISLESTIFVPKYPSFRSSLLLCYQTQIQKPFIFARKSKRRSGSQRTRKFILDSMSFMVSNLKILPPPLDLLIEEFSGGGNNGGGLGFCKGFWGGGFDGWRRKGKWKLWFLVILGLGLLFGRELESNVPCGILGIAVVLIMERKRRIRNWVLGLLWFGVLVGLGFNREDLQKFFSPMMQKFFSPMIEISRRRRKGKKSHR